MVVADAFFAASTAVVTFVMRLKDQGIRFHSQEGWNARCVDYRVVNEDVIVNEIANLARKRHEGNWDVTVAFRDGSSGGGCAVHVGRVVVDDGVVAISSNDRWECHDA